MSEASSASSSDAEDEPASKKPRTVKTMAPLEVAPSSADFKSKATQPLIIILDQATLETVKNKRGVYELLNCDDHRELCKKKLRKDPNEFRPDILHQELLALLDSPLNKAGLLKVYISTKKNVLIDVHASIRIPRTYKRFAGLMVQLLHKMKIKAATGGDESSSSGTALLKVIKNPVSQYLPAGTRCFGMSSQGTLYRPSALARALVPADVKSDEASSLPPTCFIIGAMSTGHVTMEDYPYMEKMISLSEYPLSGAAAISRLMAAIEEQWGVV
jgi:rRNA small subunit pseudouridine methyltransferase Nep1